MTPGPCREPGANPGRTRRCKWGRTPQEVTVPQVDNDETAWEDAVSRVIHEPEYLPKNDEAFPGEMANPGLIQVGPVFLCRSGPLTIREIS